MFDQEFESLYSDAMRTSNEAIIVHPDSLVMSQADLDSRIEAAIRKARLEEAQWWTLEVEWWLGEVECTDEGLLAV